MNPDQVFYVIEDPNSPPPKDLADYTKREIEFNERYFAEKGFPWRHYYGVNGPRPPPKLFMWPAKTIGEVHSVTSAHGHWYGICFCATYFFYLPVLPFFAGYVMEIQTSVFLWILFTSN